MSTITFSERYSVESLAYDQAERSGRLFVSSAGVVDLTHINLLLCSVDTVRQLYQGVPAFDFSILDTFETITDKDLYLGSPLGLMWHVRRMGKASGYRYSLSNKTKGLQILLGAYHHKLDAQYPAPHLKIECSPSFLASLTPDDAQYLFNSIASRLLKFPEPTGCAVHLALDVQRWEPASNFVSNFTTRARTLRTYTGIESAEFDLTQTAVIYGKNETYTFGKPNALQVSIYDKTKEIVHSDKVDFFAERWGGDYDVTTPVWRVECRFHQSVVRELGLEQGLDLLTYAQAAPHLDSMWQYALRNNRLRHSKLVELVNPVWQLFAEDAKFNDLCSGLYINRRKKKQDVGAISRNIGLVLGNLTTLWARSFCPDKLIRKQLKALSFWPDVLKYFHGRGLSEEDLLLKVCKDVLLRRLTHKVAA